MFLTDGAIILCGVFVFGWETVMYSLIALYIISIMTDKVVLGISQSKAFYIVTSEPDNVKEFILKNISHGVTVIDARGGYTNEKQKMLLCVVPTNAYFKLKNRVAKLKHNKVDEVKKNEYIAQFKEAIEDDLNTSNMITLVYTVLKDDISDGTKYAIIEEFDKVLSLDLTVQEENEIDKDLEEKILKKIEERKEAKKNKDFATADKIRDELLSEGIKLIDTREGTTYELIKD